MAPTLVPATMSTTMPLRSRTLSTPRCDKPRAAPPPRATPTRTPRRSWTSRSSPWDSDRPEGNPGGVSWILKSRAARLGEVRYGGDHGTVIPDRPGNADLVTPAAGRHVDRLQAADRGVRPIGRDEIDGAVDELHEPRRQFRRQVGVDVENDPMGVLPASDLLPDFLRVSDLGRPPGAAETAHSANPTAGPNRSGRRAARRYRSVAG